MSRAWLSQNAVYSILLLATCNAAANEQQQPVGAVAKADSNIASPPHEFGHQVKELQREANRQIAATKDTLMQARAEYRHATKKNLTALDRRVVELETKAKKATGKARAAQYARLKQIHTRRDAFASNFKLIDAEAAMTWDAMKARLDKDLAELMVLVSDG